MKIDGSAIQTYLNQNNLKPTSLQNETNNPFDIQDSVEISSLRNRDGGRGLDIPPLVVGPPINTGDDD